MTTSTDPFVPFEMDLRVRIEFLSGFRRLLLAVSDAAWLPLSELLYLFLMALVRVVTFFDFMTALVSSLMTLSMSSRFRCSSCSGDVGDVVTRWR